MHEATVLGGESQVARWWGRVSIVVLPLVVAVSVALWLTEETFRRAALEVCDLVADHYYRREQPDVREFVERCRVEARAQPFLASKNANIHRINDRLSVLGTSHLNLYSPVENRQIWTNQSLDTGIRSRLIDATLVVVSVLSTSPAERAGVHPGDVLVGLNGKVIPSAFHAQTGTGVFRIARGGSEREVEIVPLDLLEDLRPSLHDGSMAGMGLLGVLRIPSFLPQYFEDEDWKPIAMRIGEHERIIIDLRGNAGGSFPAMLRALSPFWCEPHEIGSVFHPNENRERDEAALENDLDADNQLEQLGSVSTLRLRTFKGYGCFRGEVTVLIDADTSSAAEIFAQALYSRPRSRVWGQPSAGQVVMAQWFPVEEFGGEAFSLSVPIAGYRAFDGTVLESQSLTPQHTLHYDLNLALAGRDSWIEEASRSLSGDGFSDGTDGTSSHVSSHVSE